MRHTRRDRIEQRIRELEAELAKIDYFPEADPFEDGTVIKFDKRFRGSGKVYPYAALRIEGDWYLTGAARPRPAMTWTGLVDFITGTEPLYRDQLVVVARGWDIIR